MSKCPLVSGHYNGRNKEMKVVNLRKEKYTHYIGRGSIFGNPFRIGKDGTREEVIESYEKWIYQYVNSGIQFVEVVDAIHHLPEDAILGCFCKPQSCHGDVIIKIWKELNETR